MSRSRYLLGNINLINIVLTGVLIALVNYMLPFMNKTVHYSLPVMAKHGEIGPASVNEAGQQKTPSPLDYVLITEQNLFYPDRKIPEETKEDAPLSKPDFVLYGTIITDDTTIAYMSDKKSPQRSPGRGVRQSALKPGDSMSGFTLREVAPDKVVMARGEETVVVLLDDPKSPKSRDIQTAETTGVQPKTAFEPAQQSSPNQQKPFLPQAQLPAASMRPASSKQTAPRGGFDGGGGGLWRLMGR